MVLAISVVPSVPADAQVIAVPIFAGRKLPAMSRVDADLDALAVLGFEGKEGELATLTASGGRTLIAVGMGDASKVTAERLRRAAAAVVRATSRSRAVTMTLLDAVPEGIAVPAAAQAISEGALLASYRFTTYKSDPKPWSLEHVALVGRGARVAAAVERAAVIARAVAMARDLVNEPPGSVTPIRLAEVATAMAAERGLACSVLDEVAIEREGLGGLRGVSLGSSQPPRLIRLEYAPARARATAAIVGKGITFDSGGLSLKTANGMMTMKSDMTGGAVVLAVMSVLPLLTPAVRVIGLVPATENLPGGRAIKPSDVLRIRNGKTVEVLNTDAEGRLVLADALSLAVEAQADVIIDIATLTGACVVALGKKIAGLMGNNQRLIDEVRAAADRAGELCWPLPLPEQYHADIDSKVADIKNIGDPAGGGALSAGLFLREFVSDVPWAHLDIAGPAWSDAEDGYLSPGGTAVGVRTLIELLSTAVLPRRRKPAQTVASARR